MKRITNFVISKYRYVFFLFCGMLFSTIMFNLLYKKGIVNSGAFNAEILAAFENVYISPRIIIWEVFKKRWEQYLVIFVASITKINWLILPFIMLFAGIGTGYIESVLALKYGWNGLIVFCGMVIPQYILYMFAFYIIAHYISDGIRGFRRIFVSILITAASVSIGALLESILSPLLLKIIYNII